MARFAALLLLLAGSSVAAQPPKAVLIGPTGGVPGDILLLDASQSSAEHFTWQVTPELPASRPTILILEGGRKCLVTSVPGTYTVFFAAGNSEGLDSLKHSITVSDKNTPPVPPGPLPAPPPGPAPDPTPPGPNPPPEPVIPPGKFSDVAAEVLKLAQEIEPAARAKSLALADAWVALANRLKANEVKGTAISVAMQMQALLIEANDAAVGSHAAAWQPFGVKLGERIVALWNAERIRQPADWEQLLREGAAVLRLVRVD